MTSLTVDLLEIPKIQTINITDDTLSVDLSDGRTISVPLAWYPRLLHGSVEERNSWRLIGSGDGIHWNQLDEDVSVKNIQRFSQLLGTGGVGATPPRRGFTPAPRIQTARKVL